MKHFLLIIIAIFPLALCTRPEINNEAEFNTKLSEFVGTRAAQPLEGTVWEHKTTEDFNRYLLFLNGEASLFYGLVDNGKLQRWSDFYSSPYVLRDGTLETNLTYPLWGSTIKTESVSVVKLEDTFHISVDGESYTFLTTDLTGLDGMWMIIFANPVPWE